MTWIAQTIFKTWQFKVWQPSKVSAATSHYAMSHAAEVKAETRNLIDSSGL